MIVNSIDAFTHWVKCEEQIHPIDCISIKGIKGYGTVIFRFGSQLLPVREVAFMPNNPQSTFTSSHLQRANSFLPGIHSLYSSAKVIDRNGISTKFIPTKRNDIDYITVSLVVPKDDPNYAIILYVKKRRMYICWRKSSLTLFTPWESFKFSPMPFIWIPDKLKTINS